MNMSQESPPDLMEALSNSLERKRGDVRGRFTCGMAEHKAKHHEKPERGGL